MASPLSRPAPVSTMANSSPPSRPNRSCGPSAALAFSAKTCSTWSPTAWPNRSLIDLKWSRSASSIDRRPARRPAAWPARGVLQEGAAVGDAGQRIDQRGGLVAQLGALLRHRQQDEGDRDGEQQRLEAEHREPDAVEHLIGRRPRQDLRQRRAQQEQRAVREQHEDRGPARHQRLAAAAPEFIGRGPGVGGDEAGREQHPRVHRFLRTAARGRRSARRWRRRPDRPAAPRGRRTRARRSR